MSKYIYFMFVIAFMTLGSASHQKPGQPGRDTVGAGEARVKVARDEARLACQQQEGLGREDLLTQVLSRENMAAAWKRVKANKGSAGVDGLTIDETSEFLKIHWPRIRSEILSGTYRPQAVRRVEIPKPTGGVAGARLTAAPYADQILLLRLISL